MESIQYTPQVRSNFYEARVYEGYTVWRVKIKVPETYITNGEMGSFCT